MLASGCILKDLHLGICEDLYLIPQQGIAADIRLPSSGVPAGVLLGFALLFSSEQGLYFRRDFSLVHCHAPLLVHFQFFPEGTYGSFSTGHQLLQILVSQLFSGSAFSRTLPTPLEFRFQVNFGWFPPSLPGLLYFASNHLTVIHVGARAARPPPRGRRGFASDRLSASA